MTSGHNVSEDLGTCGLAKLFFSEFFGKKSRFFLKKSREKTKKRFPGVLQEDRRFACLQDCLLTLTWHSAESDCCFVLLVTCDKFPLKKGEDPVELPGPLVLDRVTEVCWVITVKLSNYHFSPFSPLSVSEFVRSSGF